MKLNLTIAASARSLWLCTWAIVAACAPAQSFRPAAALPSDSQGEVGVGISRVGPRPYVAEPARPMAQGWWSAKWGERWLSTLLVGFDQSALLGGWALRANLLRSRFSASAEAEVGFAWAAFSLPIALAASERVAVYCSPRLGNWGADLTGFLPCGLSGELWHGFALRAELQLSWADFEYYNRRLHFGLAAAQQW